MLPGSPSGRLNSPRLAALLPSGKWNFDPAKSTVKTLIQYDLDLPWGNFGSSCVKVLLAEAILELFEHIPEGREAAFWKSWSIVILKGERLPQSSVEWEKGSSSAGAQIRIQKCSFFFLSFLSPRPPLFFFMYNGFFFLLFFWRTGLTHFSLNSLSAELCNGKEKKHYLFLTICHKIRGKREGFHMYVNWESVLRVVPSTSEPKVCSLMSALKSRGLSLLIVNYLKL